MPIFPYGHLTDREFVTLLVQHSNLTDLERECMERLERLVDEVEDLGNELLDATND